MVGRQEDLLGIVNRASMLRSCWKILKATTMMAGNNGRDMPNNAEKYVMKGLFCRRHVYSKYCFIARLSQGIIQ